MRDWVVVSAVLASLGSLPAWADGGDIRLKVGEQRVITIERLARVAIGDPAVVDVKSLGSGQLLLTPVGAGETTMLAFTRDDQRHTYTVYVQGPVKRPAMEGGDLVLVVGASKEVEISALARVAVGDPSVVHVESLGDGKLRLTALAVGRTTVLAFKRAGSQARIVVDVRAPTGPAAVDAGVAAPAGPADAGP